MKPSRGLGGGRGGRIARIREGVVTGEGEDIVGVKNKKREMPRVRG
jgi:hypothetical protein